MGFKIPSKPPADSAAERPTAVSRVVVEDKPTKARRIDDTRTEAVGPPTVINGDVAHVEYSAHVNSSMGFQSVNIGVSVRLPCANSDKALRAAVDRAEALVDEKLAERQQWTLDVLNELMDQREAIERDRRG